MCYFLLQNFNQTEDVKTISERAENLHNDDHKNDIDFQITLSGCGQFTSWIFPDIAQCPNASCKLEFKNRKKALDHFREVHASNAVLCFLCQKPISTRHHNDFIIHYRRIHPNKAVPYDFDKEEKLPPTQVCWTQIAEHICFLFPDVNTIDFDIYLVFEQTRSKVRPKVESVSSARDDDDLITLYSAGVTTYWRLPAGLLICPVLNCQKSFKPVTSWGAQTGRQNLVRHYKENHAKGSILCTLCDRPIRSSKGPNDFRKHYAHLHPNTTVPFNFGSVSDKFRRPNIRNVRVKQVSSS